MSAVIIGVEDELGHICDACGSGVPTQGWHVPYETLGYYDGFTDNLEALMSDEEHKYWFLCHDCIVKFLTFFPRLSSFFSRGQHPCDGDVPCCKWAWRSHKGVTQVVGDDGRWMPMPKTIDDFLF
jgi:hypothetical protein